MVIMLKKNAVIDRPLTEKDKMLEKVSGMIKLVNGNKTPANQHDGHKTLSDYSWPLLQLQKNIPITEDPRELRDINISINRIDGAIRKAKRSAGMDDSTAHVWVPGLSRRQPLRESARR
jgi:hypothetical protein